MNSKFCQVHQNDRFWETVQQIDMRPVTRQFAKKLEQVVVTEESCRKEEMWISFIQELQGCSICSDHAAYVYHITKCLPQNLYHLSSCI